MSGREEKKRETGERLFEKSPSPDPSAKTFEIAP
jgi:hypothetical protein